MSWLSQLFHPGKGYDKAKDKSQDYYNKANDALQTNLGPYAQGGMTANDKLNQFLESLSDPGKLQSDWSKGYEESPYAKQLQQGSIDKGLNAAGSMGLMGSSAALNNIQEEGSDIMQKDRQQYMNDLMQKYLAGMGIATNQFNTGANAASQIGTGQSQNAMNQGTTEANLEFGKYNAGPNMITGGLGALMKFIESMNNGGGNYGKGMYNAPNGGGY